METNEVALTLTHEQFRQLVVLGLAALLLLVGMFVYTVHVVREAYLGRAWIEAAGSYKVAAQALDQYNRATDLIIARALNSRHLPPGTLVRRDRESALKLARETRHDPPAVLKP